MDVSPQTGTGAVETPGQVFSLPQALKLAIQEQRDGHWAQAELLYSGILAAAPDHADALHFLGVLHHQTGRSDSGIELVRQAVALVPDFAGMRNNLGILLARCERLEEAVEAYREAIRLAPDDPDPHDNLGIVLRKLRRYPEAEAAYRRALELDPGRVRTLRHLGKLLYLVGRVAESIPYQVRALELDPKLSDTRDHLAWIYALTGQTEKAKAVVAEWLRREPDNLLARHVAASVTGENVPDRVDDALVASMFDSFAASFDEHLAELGYQAPDHVAAAVARAVGEPRADLAILDAGCGTGLCGPKLLPFARHLTGVDLSPRMIEKADARQVYHELHAAELSAFIQRHPASYDLIVSADTLCYFGPLEHVLAASATALRAGGVLVFTVEAWFGDDGFRLNPHGRYAHAARYVEGCLARAGFSSPPTIEPVQLRMECGEPVRGHLVTARRP